MGKWTDTELETIGEAEELRVAGLKEDDTLRRAVIIWAVRVDESIYIRSVLGPEAGWFRGTQLRGAGRVEAGGIAKDVTFTRNDEHDDAVTDAYWAKYGRGKDVVAINSELATSTTLRVDPR